MANTPGLSPDGEILEGSSPSRPTNNPVGRKVVRVRVSLPGPELNRAVASVTALIPSIENKNVVSEQTQNKNN